MLEINVQNTAGYGVKDNSNKNFLTYPNKLFEDRALNDFDEDKEYNQFSFPNQVNAVDNLMLIYISIVDTDGNDVDISDVTVALRIKPDGINDYYYLTRFDLENNKSIHSFRNYPRGEYQFVVLEDGANSDALATVHISLSY